MKSFLCSVAVTCYWKMGPSFGQADYARFVLISSKNLLKLYLYSIVEILPSPRIAIRRHRDYEISHSYINIQYIAASRGIMRDVAFAKNKLMRSRGGGSRDLGTRGFREKRRRARDTMRIMYADCSRASAIMSLSRRRRVYELDAAAELAVCEISCNREERMRGYTRGIAWVL